MKHVRRLLVLLLFVNCTTDSPNAEEVLEVSATNQVVQNCVNDAPKVRLTNNGTHSFEFIVYAEDYSLLHSGNVSATANSGWVELSQNDVLAVATNDIVYGQKIPLNLQLCDNLELEIDINNTLMISGE
ncbi:MULTISPECIES: hypothetical protein [Winogradskyella]|uniref:Lipoprotein n=1 Tax=Winogradskyella ouciana TaxID=2608631 RepID=A0A7K1GDA0_9FLAO|nr:MULTISPECIES: hypothetical protein [Winogradskyella]MBO6881848.1 hypothetical protein [Winogradskyella sp.]MTE26414.1 hypothetical protein [Winogradskyella ouciana]